jgi:hypothetical protein
VCVCRWLGKATPQQAREYERAMADKPRRQLADKPRRQLADKPRRQKYTWELKGGGKPFTALNGTELAAILAALGGQEVKRKKGDSTGQKTMEARRVALEKEVRKKHREMDAAEKRGERERRKSEKEREQAEKEQARLLQQAVASAATAVVPWACADRTCQHHGQGCPGWRRKQQREQAEIAGVENEWAQLGDDELTEFTTGLDDSDRDAAAAVAAAAAAGSTTTTNSAAALSDDEFGGAGWADGFDPDAAVAAAAAAGSADPDPGGSGGTARSLIFT